MFFGGCQGWTAAMCVVARVAAPAPTHAPAASYLECLTNIFIQGFILGVVLLRIQRADRRANQIVFTDKAAVLCVRGRFFLTFQALDLQGEKPLINASVRMVACLHDASPELHQAAFWQTRAMRVTRPDDEIGGKLWLTVPAVVVHEIDAWSPLAPPELTQAPQRPEASVPNRFPQPPQRALDGRIGSRTQALCPVCGAGMPTDAALRRHIAYFALEELERGRPPKFGHRGMSASDATRPVVVRRLKRGRTLAGQGPQGVAQAPVPETVSVSALGGAGYGSGGEGAARQAQAPPAQPAAATSPSPAQDPAAVLPLNVPVFHQLTPEHVCASIAHRIRTRRIEVIVLIEGTDPRTSNS